MIESKALVHAGRCQNHLSRRSIRGEHEDLYFLPRESTALNGNNHYEDNKGQKMFLEHSLPVINTLFLNVWP